MQTSLRKRLSIQPLSHRLLATILPAALLFFSACEEPIDGIAEEILPPGETVEIRFTDSLAITLATQRIEDIPTYRAERQLVGNYVDPHFGRLSATTYTEVVSRSGLDFGAAEDLIYDSLVLRLTFDGAYGNLSDPLMLSVYELMDTVPEEENATNLRAVSFNTTQPLVSEFPLQLEDGTGTITLRLDDELGRRLLFADAETLGDRSLFRDFFKGIALTTEPVKFFSREPGAIYQLVSASNDTQLELSYRQRDPENPSIFQARVEPFLITSSTPRYHQVERTEVDDKLLATAHVDPDTLDEWEFLQGGSPIRIWVQMPELATLGEVAVSRAELVLPVATEFLGGDDRFTPPSDLFAVLPDAAGNIDFTDAGNAQSLADVGITYQSSEQQYSILLTRYVQQIISEQLDNNGIILIPISRTFRIQRAILRGTGNSTRTPKLKLTYSTLPE